MKPRTHRCAATGCQHDIPLHLLMCIDHWRMVPAPLRREVLATSKDSLRSHHWNDAINYRRAVQDAVAALEAKQIQKNTTRAALEGDLFGSPEPDPGQQLQPETQHVLRHRRTGRGEPSTPERS